MRKVIERRSLLETDLQGVNNNVESFIATLQLVHYYCLRQWCGALGENQDKTKTGQGIKRGRIYEEAKRLALEHKKL